MHVAFTPLLGVIFNQVNIRLDRNIPGNWDSDNKGLYQILISRR